MSVDVVESVLAVAVARYARSPARGAYGESIVRRTIDKLIDLIDRFYSSIAHMMRLTLKRLFISVFVIFCTTLIILALPRKGFEREWESKPPGSFESENIGGPARRFLAERSRRPTGVGDQNILPNQPPPPKLTGEFDGLDPFAFYSSPSKKVLAKLARYLKEVDWSEMKKECPQNSTLAEYWSQTKRKKVSKSDSWESFYAEIGSCDVYRNTETIDNLFKDLSTLPIKEVHIMDGGTQVKLIFTFENDKQAVFKPMRFGRNYESDPNHFYFSDFERHNAEIATFHLDKILGFRRAVPTVGRIVNITSELLEKAEKKLKKTFFVSPAKNQCFVSRCDYYCDTTHAICGSPDLKEGSVQVFLPDENAVPRKHNRSPYRRTYSKKNQLADWQTNMDYCNAEVKKDKKYAHGRRLLDLVDLHIMDFLIGNQDRHHYESFDVFSGHPAYAVHLDNGRAFGRTDFDDLDILLPLKQCCVIRPSTLKTLSEFYKNPKSLTKTLHESMSKDPVFPILAYKHYPALERRLGIIMEALAKCLDDNGAKAVVMSVFHNPKVPETDPNDYVEEEESGDTKQAPQQVQPIKGNAIH
ncbi:famk-1 [Pristionchus pacificus]|uniref:Fam20C domain-containing protein n=1 Tax=Pristionchus pacificus TaxID=54126 RepID=A0A2A6B313_PRIPA|nr:famk-1 [Pristionchus pacificus]|eukprot:PDM60264.1 hypothetical protein PRIPAC_54089 [Pristionchus pacificus]